MLDKWFKKEKPFQGFAGFGGGAVSRLVGGASANTFDVSGGNATSTAGDYKYFYFTSPGNLTVASTAGTGELAMSFMLIGAGAGGDSTGGGGGGAGAFIQKIDYPVQSIPSSNVTMPISIGSASTSPYEAEGSPSSFAIPNSWNANSPKTFAANRGGRGRSGTDGNPGGSGGGGGRGGPNAGGNATAPQTIDGSGNTPDAGIGYPGGDGAQNFPDTGGGTGGGGGGAGGAGYDSPGTDNQPYESISGGQGGNGRAAFAGDVGVSPSYGTPGPGPGRYFAGGGGGGNHSKSGPGDSPGGVAGYGGGASGSPRNSPNFGGTPVTANTGGGGGGGGGTSNGFVGAGSAGASGICIVRIAQENISN